ncbi:MULTISPECIES: SLC13 family permease [Gordonia]|uniref:Arsenite resistance pump n=1 Tax=Gordonia sputi NBRC 100414 TaxID=1089453 RepID=H5TY26_9ACTN|nr:MULTISPECIES: SLC13 family permease [Gordonia]OBA43062.1 arsenic transporter [Gordonia sp. 852002-51296_SCH5728562-b]GAB38384.1 arsenite resistance pump [Gordonia sputi NBRC 100414]
MIEASSAFGTVVAVVVMVVTIVATVSVTRVPAAVVAVPAAVLVVALGLVDWHTALAEVRFMLPTIGFLAAMLVVAEICARAGVFVWVGVVLARWSRGSAIGLLRIVFVVAAITTAVLSLDTTIVLLTPVAVLTARHIGARVTPIAFASNHLANSASTLLPVSNLTNLLAFGAAGLSFTRFAAIMAWPWVAAIVVEYLVFRWFFAVDLRSPRGQREVDDPPEPDVPDVAHDHSGGGESPRAPLLTLAALGVLLVGFVVAEPLGVPLAAVAGIGALVMALPSLWRAPAATCVDAVRAAGVPFLIFVAALGVIILPVRNGPVGDLFSTLMPSGAGLLALLGAAVIAAIAANLFNNLPATLLLVPLVAGQPALVLAILLGVNIGPNLAVFGSLANLLWRDVMRRHSASTSSRVYLSLGLVSVPLTLVAAVLALWVGLRAFG